MSYIQLKEFLDSKTVTLVAVSKTKPISRIQELYDKGQRDFGENRVQELVDKHQALPDDIEWHMIGTLQKNKVKYIAPFVSMVHSVDNLALAEIIDKMAKKNNRIIDILIQIKIAAEESKHGYDWFELKEELAQLRSLQSIRIRGLMGMGTFTSDEKITRSEFQFLKDCFGSIKEDLIPADTFDTLSMGMSGDYLLAVEEGSTMVRIGSLLFGSRY